MSLRFDVDKDKSIAMMVETSGIDDTNKLDFTFNITVNGIKYGFPCKMEEGKVNICIPALSEVIKGLKVGKYKASLDVTGDKNYFLQPFNEDVELTMTPKVKVLVDDDGKETNMVEAITASISKIVDNDEEVNTTNESLSPDSINTNEEEADAPSVKSVVNKMFK